MIKRIYILLTLLAVLVLPSGCIKEDYDDCDNVIIYFQYLADGKTNVLNDYITKVDLYVFDENGRIMGVGHYGEDELKRYAAIPSFRLTPGRRYKVAAVGNAFDRTEVENFESETEFSEIFLQHPAWQSGEGKVDGHDHNYLGQHEFFVPDDKEFTVYRDTVTLYSAHIDVDVEINGLPAPDASEGGEIPYELRIEQSNAQVDLNGNINMEDKGTCYPTLVWDSGKGIYRTDDLCLFRMDDHSGHVDEDCCEHQLVLVDNRTGEELVRGDIYDYVKANEEEFDITKQEATLPIAIVFDQMGIHIKLPQWWVEDIKPGWN